MSDENNTYASDDEADDAAAESGADVVVDDAQAEPDPNAVAVTINGKQVEATKGQLIITAAQDQGAYVPHFCYHPRMKPVGMCRQCLVEVDTGRGPQLMPSCMFPVAPDMVIDTESATVKRAQEGMIELLLANHPLDCPVCDKGGECPLQDQAFSHGPGESRFVEEKRHYEKPIPISDLVLLDRERCILCDRCTRFADEVAGDKLIHFTQRGNQTQVMTFPDEPFASYFSGNTVQICPVGALTAEPYRFKARPWDLEQQESTCTTCSVGCRTVVQSSRDEVMRYQGVDCDPVNHGWLCDRGRFSFEALSSEHRLTDPQVQTEAGLVATNWSAGLDAVAKLVREALSTAGPESIALLGGARGTNEDAYAWAQLADALGVTTRDAQLGDGLPAEILGLKRATIDQAASASTVVVLGPDIKEELPVLYLRLRDAVTNGSTQLVEFAANETGLTRYASRSIRHQPGMQAAAARELLADETFRAQLAEGDVVVVAGRPNLAESAGPTIAAMHLLLGAAPQASVLPALRRGNVVGALSVGLAPVSAELDGHAALRAAADGKIELLILLGSDPINDCPDQELARRAIATARHVVAIDTFPTESAKFADVVLPAAAYAEKSGTTTNLEGRVTTVAQRVTAAGTSRPDWMIAAELSLLLDDVTSGSTPLDDATSVDDLTAAIAANVAGFDAATPAALTSNPDGVLAIGGPAGELPDGDEGSTRNSYDHRLVVSRKLYDRAVGTAMSRSISELPAPAAAHLNPLDAEAVGVVDGGSVNLVGNRGSVVLPVAFDASIARGNVWVPFNTVPDVGATRVEALIAADAVVTDVRIAAF